MKDHKDTSTKDWVNDASALKNESGEVQIPAQPQNLLTSIIIHAKTEGRDPVELIQDIHDATCFWLTDYDMRQNIDNPTSYVKGLNS